MNKEELKKAWETVPEQYNHCAVDIDFKVNMWTTKPKINHENGYFVGCCTKKLTIGNHLARIAIKKALDQGWENSLIERPKDEACIWKPEKKEEYYFPNNGVDRGYSLYKFDRYSEDFKPDLVKLNRCLCFKEQKYARWVAKYGVNPATLQAALAVDGLATEEQWLSSEYLDFIDIYIHKGVIGFYRSSEKTRQPSCVYFKSREKRDEALNVIMPSGLTLENELLRGAT